GCLARFITSSFYKPDRLPDRFFKLMKGVDRPLRLRWQSGLPSDKVTRRWSLEVPEIFARRVVKNHAWAEQLMFRRDAVFDRWVSKRFVTSGDIFWGFQGSCLESLRSARSHGLVAVCEFATAHVTRAIRVLSEEAKRHPEWADSISNFCFPNWYRERLEQEPHSASICVAASQFTRDSLLEVGVPDDKICLLPLGVDLTQFTPIQRPLDGPFRILFVGGIGQRKGIKYLLEAYRRIRAPSTELVLVGPVCGSGRALRSYDGLFTNLGRLDQAQVVEQMRRCHVLVLPSVFEGFGLVIPEAMATGMPVIASRHSTGPEIISNGENGYVLEHDDIDGLAKKLQWLAEHRRQCIDMGKSAIQAAAKVSWEAHQQRLNEILTMVQFRLKNLELPLPVRTQAVSED
ncbi:MAG TPA: glycosyltransferase family 4 protein, partial [Pirellulales bacterium]|nr:glycosyltransferase family 4 protein [Pirellulales bacterium]